MDTDIIEKRWQVKELTMQEIRDVAEYKGLSLEGVDVLDIVSSVERGVDAALDNWGQIITEAIRNTGAKNLEVVEDTKETLSYVETNRVQNFTQLPDDDEDRCIITATVRCTEIDKDEVISSIKSWYGGHDICMSDLRISTQGL